MIKKVFLTLWPDGNWGYVLHPTVTKDLGDAIEGDGIIRVKQRTNGEDTSNYKHHYAACSDEFNGYDEDTMLSLGWTKTGKLNVNTGDFELAN